MENKTSKLPLTIVDPNPKDAPDCAMSLELGPEAHWENSTQSNKFMNLMDILYDEGCPFVISARCWKELLKTGGPCTVYVGTTKQCYLVKAAFEDMRAIVDIQKI